MKNVEQRKNKSAQMMVSNQIPNQTQLAPTQTQRNYIIIYYIVCIACFCTPYQFSYMKEFNCLFNSNEQSIRTPCFI